MIEAYVQENYRPVKFKTPQNVDDGLEIQIKVFSTSDSQQFDVTWDDSPVVIDKQEEFTVAICDFTKESVPSGIYFIVIQTVSPVTVVSKDVLTLYNESGHSLEQIE